MIFRTICRALVIFVLVSLIGATHVLAGEIPPPSAQTAASMPDEELTARTDFLIERLEAGQRNAQIWQYGFTTGWSLGVVVGSAQAAATDSADTRVNGIVTATKSVIGVARLLIWPHPGRLGADEVLAMPSGSRDERVARLLAAEQQLVRTANYAEQRTEWLPHLANVALNAAGAGIIAGIGDETDAIVSGVVGVAAGELLLWTMPWRSGDDLEDYRSRFGGGPTKPSTSWHFVPHGTGASIVVRF